MGDCRETENGPSPPSAILASIHRIRQSQAQSGSGRPGGLGLDEELNAQPLPLTTELVYSRVARLHFTDTSGFVCVLPSVSLYALLEA